MIEDEKIRRAKIRISEEDLERVKVFQKEKGYSRDRAYGELIKRGLNSID